MRRNISSGSPYEDAVGYSRAVRLGPHVAVAGTTGRGEDAATQTRDALARIEAALREAGASLNDVVRTRIYVTDISTWPESAPPTPGSSAMFGRSRPWWRSLP